MRSSNPIPRNLEYSPYPSPESRSRSQSRSLLESRSRSASHSPLVPYRLLSSSRHGTDSTQPVSEVPVTILGLNTTAWISSETRTWQFSRSRRHLPYSSKVTDSRDVQNGTFLDKACRGHVQQQNCIELDVPPLSSSAIPPPPLFSTSFSSTSADDRPLSPISLSAGPDALFASPSSSLFNDPSPRLVQQACPGLEIESITDFNSKFPWARVSDERRSLLFILTVSFDQTRRAFSKKCRRTWFNGEIPCPECHSVSARLKETLESLDLDRTRHPLHLLSYSQLRSAYDAKQSQVHTLHTRVCHLVGGIATMMMCVSR